MVSAKAPWEQMTELATNAAPVAMCVKLVKYANNAQKASIVSPMAVVWTLAQRAILPVAPETRNLARNASQTVVLAMIQPHA